MNWKIIIIIIAVALAAIAAAQPASHHNALIASPLENNSAAQEIAALGIPVTYEELGQDSNNYTVQGQTWIITYPDNSVQAVKVILDDDVDPNSYLAHAILYHELGHIVNAAGVNDEASADNYAASRGYNIVDAYHGIH